MGGCGAFSFLIRSRFVLTLEDESSELVEEEERSSYSGCSSSGEPCAVDFLRVEISTRESDSVSLDICPAANLPLRQKAVSNTADDQRHFSFSSIQGEGTFALGPVYNFTSINFQINFQLAHSPLHPHSTLSRGWGKGLLFEYICKCIYLSFLAHL